MDKNNKLDEEMLKDVSGGKILPGGNTNTKLSECKRCNRETLFILGTGGRAVCSECGEEKLM